MHRAIARARDAFERRADREVGEAVGVEVARREREADRVARLRAAATPQEGRELWKSNGSASGTALVADIDPGPPSSRPAGFLEVGPLLLFSAQDASSGTELWKTDGATGGTARVKDINPGSAGSSPTNLFAGFDGTAFFGADDGTTGVELWRSDGSAAGTVLVRDVNPGSPSSNPSQFALAGRKLLFTALEVSTGNELWTSGTRLVDDVAPPGTEGSFPVAFTDGAGTTWFTANDGVTGGELWKSDGTAAGTALVLDILPGSASSGPRNFEPVGDELYFVA